MVKEALDALRSTLPSGVELVAVSKFHPVSRLMEAYDAGQRIFAESRPQELAVKVPQMPADVQWHFIGHLQTNKLKMVLPYVDLVQSVDSLHLLEAINAWGKANGKVVNVLLELHLGAEDTKQGFTEDQIRDIVIPKGTPSETSGHPRPAPSGQVSPSGDDRGDKRSLPEREGPAECRDWEQACLVTGTGLCGRGRSEAEAVSEGVPFGMTGVRIKGIMGMATNTEDMAVVERDFERIERLFLQLQAVNPSITELSIGMSGDWPVAVRHHATMVRIGTDIFGPREY